MRAWAWWKTAILWLALQALGCTEDVRFDPAGCDVQITGKWTVNGQFPDAETCDNIELVELAIINDEGDEFWSADELLLPCDQGSGGAGGIGGAGGAGGDQPVYLNSFIDNRDRCGGTGEVLEGREGPYRYRWRAITDLNYIVDCSAILSQEIEPANGGSQLVLNLPPVNFVTREAGTQCPETN
jgi:hypothetical protein